MSDPNKFINTYIDTIMATLHEYLGSSLQIKTQLKMANDLLAEKDAVLAQLNNEVEQYRQGATHNDVVSNELAQCRDKLQIAEDSHNALKVKVSHMDTLTAQMAEMKNDIISKTGQIGSLTEQVGQLTTDLQANKNRIVELESLVAQRDEVIANKDKEISNLKIKLDPPLAAKLPDPPVTKVKASDLSSSAVKVQLNTKSKVKERPVDDDF